MRKVAKLHFLDNPQKSFKTTKVHINRTYHCEITAISKDEKFVFFGGTFFKIKISDILNFQLIKCLGKGLPYLKNEGIGVNYCWNYGSSKLLLHFIKYRLDQLYNKHMKTAVNSTIYFFEIRYQKKYSAKVFCPTHYKMRVLQNSCEIEQKSFLNR